ncbi:LuxR C-terminal-related transcriptional regulator [Nocardioides humi]|uniref:HTH luxR-type domain-containing protein n=1 Tax=Nocardioides humi TaxID=449461 RepID=A0ABN2AE05_9ACTN|nr:LuxR C-terminal-related transcriptional regulator [Nocardioides humi]
MREVEQAYIEHVPNVLHAAGHGLNRYDLTTSESVSIVADVTSDFMSGYQEYGRFDDPVMSYIREYGRPVDDSRVPMATPWEQTAVYELLAADGFHHSLRAPVVIAGQFAGAIAFARSRSHGTFRSSDLTIARRVAEQLALAMERALRFEQTGRRVTLLEDALNHVPQGLIVIGADGLPIFVNRAASTPPRGHARADVEIVGDHGEEIRQELWSNNRRIATMNLTDGCGGRKLVAKSVKLGGSSAASLTLVYRTEESGGPQSLPFWDVLTPRENEIAELVSAGLTTKQIAERAFISENTVKQHLKRIFTKTDVRNRAELMQRVWSAGKRPDAGPVE